MRIASNVSSLAKAIGSVRVGGASRMDDREVTADRGGEIGVDAPASSCAFHSG